MAKQTIDLEKLQYGLSSVNALLDRKFTEFAKNPAEQDIQALFQIYEDIFFEIPETGEKSHTTLFERSRDYLREYIDPKDATIEDLEDKIEELNQTVLDKDLEILTLTTEASEQQAQFAEELAAAQALVTDSVEGVGVDEEDGTIFVDVNDDGIPDEQQSFSNYGSPRRLILTTGNDKADGFLSRPDNEYYKDKHYGSAIYKYKKKVNKKTDRIVIYLGARGKKGKRFIKDLNSGNTYKIKKKHWKSKNYNKIFGGI